MIFGDININYLENCKKRQQLDALLQTYNLIGTVSFPTRKSKASTTAITYIHTFHQTMTSLKGHSDMKHCQIKSILTIIDHYQGQYKTQQITV